MSNLQREPLDVTQSQNVEEQMLINANKVIESKRRMIMVVSAIIFLVVIPYFIFRLYGGTANFVLLYGLIMVIWGAFGYTIYFYAGPQLSTLKYHGMGGGHGAQGRLMILGEIYRDLVIDSDEIKGDHLMDKPTGTVYLFGAVILIGFLLTTFGFFLL